MPPTGDSNFSMANARQKIKLSKSRTHQNRRRKRTSRTVLRNWQDENWAYFSADIYATYETCLCGLRILGSEIGWVLYESLEPNFAKFSDFKLAKQKTQRKTRGVYIIRRRLYDENYLLTCHEPICGEKIGFWVKTVATRCDMQMRGTKK